MIRRDDELHVALETLEVAAQGAAGLVLTGPAGIGKTTIWRALIADAGERGFRVLTTRAVEAETQLSFSGLTDLLGTDIDEVIDGLPPAQRTAMEIALQRAPVGEVPPSPLAVSIGTTTTLRLLSARSPLVIAVDDLPWLDAESARVLAYAVRRASSMRLALLGAVRAPEPDPVLPAVALAFDGPVRQLAVGPLGLDAIDELVRQHLGLALRRPDLARLERESGGNPFHALEIARRLGDDVGGGLIGPGRSGSTSEALARARIEALPGPTRRTLAAVSALSRPTTRLLQEALPGCEGSIDEAIAAGVLEDDRERLRFSHPLLAEAAYDLPEDTERRRLHQVLADALSDREERARHLALAVVGPDQAVAEVLEQAARHALAQGATESAAELSLEATARTPDERSDDRHRRTLAAAELLIRAGDPDRARSLLEGHLPSLPAGPQRAAVLRLIADARSSDDVTAKAEILEEALAEAGDDHGLRSQLLHDLVYTSWLLVHPADEMLARAREAVVEADAQADPVIRYTAYRAQVMAAYAVGLGFDVDRLAAAMELAEGFPGGRLLWSPDYAEALLMGWSDQLEAARAAGMRLRRRAEGLGDWDSLPHILADLAETLFRLGSWSEADACAGDAERAFRQNGQALGLQFPLRIRAEIAIGRGDETSARRLAEEAEGLARSCKATNLVLACRRLWGTIELTLGDAQRAAAELEAADRPIREAGYLGLRVIAELPEALVLAGRGAEAEELLAGHEADARRLDRPSALAACSRVRGLLAADDGDEDRAELAFADALAQHARVSEPFEEARTRLLLGQSRRRFRRRGQAAEALVGAASLFEQLGARIWLERTRAELARTGHGSPDRDLSPTQHQIAVLVAAGQTNREVAEALFMSPHTVEAHLTRIYRSLGVRGRTELARAFASSGDAGPAGRDEGVG